MSNLELAMAEYRRKAGWDGHPEAIEAVWSLAHRSVFEGISSATLLKPGDRVLLTVSGRWTQQQLHDANEYVGKKWPDIEFVFATEVDDVIIKPAEEGGRTEWAPS